MSPNSEQFSQYLNVISAIPRLSAEEERALFLKGDKQRVVYHHLSIIPGLVRPFVNDSVSYEDIVQQGNLALAEAADRFDLSKDARFITYAHFYVEKRVKEFLTDSRHPVRLKMNKAFRRLMASWKTVGVTPPVSDKEKQDIAMALDIKVSDVERFVSWRYTPYLTIFSTDADASSMISPDELEDEDFDVLTWLINQDVDRLIFEAIAKLPPRLARILQERTFAPAGEAKRLERLGREMNLTTERVRQIEKQAIDKLREILGEKMLSEIAVD